MAAMRLRNRFGRIDVGAQPMPRDASQALDLQHSLGRHHSTGYPFGNRLLRNAEQSSHFGLPPRFLNRRSKVVLYSRIHVAKHYRYFLFFQQANLVGKATGPTCSFDTMRKKGAKDPEKIRIGLAIAKARAKHGFTQLALAKAMGVTQQSVGEWETGEALPRGNRLSKLAKLLPSLQAIFADAGRVAHHFTLRAQDYAILSPEQQDQVDGLISLIEETLKRADGNGSFKAPPKS